MFGLHGVRCRLSAEPIHENSAYLVFSFCMKQPVGDRETLFAPSKARQKDGFQCPTILNRISYQLLDAAVQREWGWRFLVKQASVS